MGPVVPRWRSVHSLDMIWWVGDTSYVFWTSLTTFLTGRLRLGLTVWCLNTRLFYVHQNSEIQNPITQCVITKDLRRCYVNFNCKNFPSKPIIIRIIFFFSLLPPFFTTFPLPVCLYVCPFPCLDPLSPNRMENPCETPRTLESKSSFYL